MNLMMSTFYQIKDENIPDNIKKTDVSWSRNHPIKNCAGRRNNLHTIVYHPHNYKEHKVSTVSAMIDMTVLPVGAGQRNELKYRSMTKRKGVG